MEEPRTEHQELLNSWQKLWCPLAALGINTFQTAISIMAAWNMGRSDSMSPATFVMLSKLCQRWGTILTGSLAGCCEQTLIHYLFIHLVLPGLSDILRLHLVRLSVRWGSVDSSVLLYITGHSYDLILWDAGWHKCAIDIQQDPFPELKMQWSNPLVHRGLTPHCRKRIGNSYSEDKPSLMRKAPETEAHWCQSDII